MSKITKNKLAMLALAGLGAVAFTEPTIAAMTVDSNGGLEVFELNDNNYWFKLSGRLMADNVWFWERENPRYGFPSGADIRSAQVTLRGGVGGNWVYKLDLKFKDAADNPGRSYFGDAYIGYNPCPDVWFAVGQVGIPFGLENWTSFSKSPLMENSNPSEAFAPDNGIGLYGEWHGSFATLAAVVYRPGAGYEKFGDVISTFEGTPNVNVTGERPGSDPWGLAGRLTFAPIHNDCDVLHSGFSARYEDLRDRANLFNFATQTELRTRQSPLIFSNIPPYSAHSYEVYGFELAGRHGPYLLQGEYMLANVERDNYLPNDVRNPGGNLHYAGYYVLGSWIVTGETKEYEFDSGTFGGVKPKCKWGALELLARYSYVDLLDDPALATRDPLTGLPLFFALSEIEHEDIIGGVHSTTLGATWWVNDNVRFLANYVYMALPDDHVSGVGVRAQVTW